MGTACAGCARKDERSTIPPNSSHDVNAVLLEYLEKSRDPQFKTEPTNKLKKSNRLNMAFDSATNYWLNGEGGLFDSTHRTAITYRVDNMSQLMRVHNSIITENVTPSCFLFPLALL